MNGQMLYTLMRRRGEVIVAAADVRAIATARTLAKRDGLVVRSARERGTRGMSPSQRKYRPYVVALTRPGSDLIERPDSCASLCMTEDLGDGLGERVVEHSARCVEHPEHDG